MSYTPEQREELVKQFEEWREEGHTAIEAAKKVGAAPKSQLKGWLEGEL